jgi:hypothetical protein
MATKAIMVRHQEEELTITFRDLGFWLQLAIIGAYTWIVIAGASFLFGLFNGLLEGL